jgi:endonuclease/exonuclease/phosphatase family metal-dependent hydrolase
VLIRSWNVYHGRSYPPGRRGYVEAAVRLAGTGDPDVVCLQELPLWAVPRLAGWTGLRAFGARTRRAPLGARAGRTITSAHYAALRAAFTGQANAMLVAPGRESVSLGSRVLSNPREHPRVCQAVRLDDRLVVANIHASPNAAETQVERALDWLDGLVRAGEPLVLAGDFNASPTLPGFSAPHGGIDDVLVRGTEASRFEVWPEERRRQNGVVLSDHTPVELTVP